MAFISPSLVLENSRVQLRRLTMEDTVHLLPFSLHEADLWKFSLLNGSGKDNLDIYLQQALQDWETGASFPFVVFG